MTLAFTSQVSLTTAARQVIDGATRYAAEEAATAIEPDHLLRALLDAPNSLAVRTLQELGARPEEMRAAFASRSLGQASETPEMSEASRQALFAAYREAEHLGHYQVDAVHLLVGLLYDGQGQAARMLEAQGITLYELRQHLLEGPRRWQSYGWRSYVERLRGVIRVSPVFWTLLTLWIGSGIGLWFLTADAYIRPMTMLFIITGWTVSLCIHEFGHALAAYLGGDHSAHAAGYLSLNPLRYANPLFSIIIPLVFLLAGGIGLPGGAVFVNTGALRSTRWQRIVSAAGPVGTMLFGLLVIAPFWFVSEDTLFESYSPFWPALALLGFLQVSALVFNLLPVPPLDGFGIIEPSLPQELRYRLRMVGNLTLFVLFTLLWSGGPIADTYWTSIFNFSEAIGIPAWLVGEGLAQFMIS